MIQLEGQDKEDVFRLIMSLIKKFKLEELVRASLNKGTT